MGGSLAATTVLGILRAQGPGAEHSGQTFPLDSSGIWQRSWAEAFASFWRLLKVREAAWQRGQSPGLAWKQEGSGFVCPWARHLPSLATGEIRALDYQRVVGILFKKFSYSFP